MGNGGGSGRRGSGGGAHGCTDGGTRSLEGRGDAEAAAAEAGADEAGATDAGAAEGRAEAGAASGPALALAHPGAADLTAGDTGVAREDKGVCNFGWSVASGDAAGSSL
jgi:hypothetical protein